MTSQLEVVTTEISVTEAGTPRKYKFAGIPAFKRINKILTALEHPMTAAELAGEMRTFPANMHRTLNLLCEAGWIAEAGVKRGGWNRASRLWRRRVRLVHEDEFLVTMR